MRQASSSRTRVSPRDERKEFLELEAIQNSIIYWFAFQLRRYSTAAYRQACERSVRILRDFSRLRGEGESRISAIKVMKDCGFARKKDRLFATYIGRREKIFVPAF
jgi:hypothetical protein